MKTRRFGLSNLLALAATLAASAASAQPRAARPPMRGDGPPPAAKPFNITRPIPRSTPSSPPTRKPS